MTAHPEAGLVFSDADVIDDQNQLVGATLWQRLGFAGKRERDLLGGQYIVLAKHRFVTGATVMFRAGLRDRFLPIAAGWIHDEWIALIAAAFSDLRPIDQPLIRYRIHGSQQVGFAKQAAAASPGKDPRAEALGASGRVGQRSAAGMRCLVGDGSGYNGEKFCRPTSSTWSSCRSGRSLPAARLARLGPVLRRYPQYRVHASGLASAFKDLALEREG